MENSTAVMIWDVLRWVFPLGIAVIGWYIWSLKQKFLSKQEFMQYKEGQQNVIKTLENKIIKQSEDTREIKADIRHIAETIKDIKEYLFKRRR